MYNLILDENKSAYRSLSPPYIGISNQEIPLQVNACGFQQPKTIEIGCNRPIGLADYLMIYMFEGSGFFHIDGKKTLVQAGHVLLFPPNTPQIIHYMPKLKSTTFWVHFTGSFAGRLLEQCQIQSPTTRVGSSPVLANLYVDMTREIESKKDHYDLLGVARLFEIAVTISRLATELQISENPERQDLIEPNTISSMTKLFEKQYNRHWTVNELARLCSFTPNHFIASFKKQTGFTPMDYLYQIRIRKADELLSLTDLKIKDIAHLVGFENPLYFSRRYCESFGFPPSYRRRFFKDQDEDHGSRSVRLAGEEHGFEIVTDLKKSDLT